MNERIILRSSAKVEVFAPAKVNLFLAVTGKGVDGYHQLITLMGKLGIGDIIKIEKSIHETGIWLKCPGFEELENENNLVSLAVRKWFEKTGEDWGCKILLEKIIPSKSGLGGGSADAVAALWAMNALGEKKLSPNDLIGLAAQIGSDCPSFCEPGFCLAMGRGERITPVNYSVSENLLGQEILLFRPNIGFSTREIYQQLSREKHYSTEAWAKERLTKWKMKKISTIEFLHNDLEYPVFRKHVYFEPLFNEITNIFGLHPRLSGSGSCCFVLLPPKFDQVRDLQEMIYEAWGRDTWLKKSYFIS